MARYASGKKAWGFSDRSGFRYRLSEMMTEWNGMKVGPDEYEPKHPQLTQTHTGSDPQALFEPRPRNDKIPETVVFPIFDLNTFVYKESPKAVGSVGTVTLGGSVITPTDVTGVSATGAVGTVVFAGSAVTITATYTVTVVSTAYGNKYAIDGVQQATASLSEGNTYRFDQSDSSNSGHPLRFSTTSNGTHSSGSEYTTGVVTSGTPGSAGAYTQITVASSAPTLYYYCTNHSAMGGTANTP